MFYKSGLLSLLSLFFLPFQHSPLLLSHLIYNPFFFLNLGLQTACRWWWWWIQAVVFADRWLWWVGFNGCWSVGLLIGGFNGWVAGWVLMVADRWGDGWVLITVDLGLLALGFLCVCVCVYGGFCLIMNLFLYLMVASLVGGASGFWRIL